MDSPFYMGWEKKRGLGALGIFFSSVKKEKKSSQSFLTGWGEGGEGSAFLSGLPPVGREGGEGETPSTSKLVGEKEKRRTPGRVGNRFSFPSNERLCLKKKRVSVSTTRGGDHLTAEFFPCGKRKSSLSISYRMALRREGRKKKAGLTVVWRKKRGGSCVGSFPISAFPRGGRRKRERSL